MKLNINLHFYLIAKFRILQRFKSQEYFGVFVKAALCLTRREEISRETSSLLTGEFVLYKTNNSIHILISNFYWKELVLFQKEGAEDKFFYLILGKQQQHW